MSWRRWLGLAERGQPAAPAQRPDTSEAGTTGTSFFSGYLHDIGEYKTDLTYTDYEKMRRSDGQVAATLAGMKLPIRSADWKVIDPENASPVEKEAGDLVRSCLFEELEFDQVVENALLMLDFGVAAHADHWYVDGNRVRIKKLKPLLPVTFQRWIVDRETEELQAIEQFGVKVDTYITTQVKMDRLALFTFQREGSNFAGRSVCRPMYQHWYIKSNLYKIDAIACERNGMGVPWVTMAQDAKKEDIAEAKKWVESFCAHQKAGIVLPPGWAFGLEGMKGTARDPKDSIAHHNMAISMAGLAQFMMLGQTESGSRALGQTMSDFFYLSLEATARKIARVLNLTTVWRLCNYNFAGLTRYPEIRPQQILSVRFESVVAALKDLASGAVDAIRPDDELEDWVRQKVGAPKRGKARIRQISGVTGVAAAGRPGETAATATVAAETRLAAAERGVVVDGVRVAREPKPVERCLALAEIVSALDAGRNDIAAALREARSRVQAEVVHKAVAAPLAQIHRISLAPDVKLTAAVETVLARVYSFGVVQVDAERTRQQAGRVPSGAAQVRMAEKRTPLGVYADATVAEFENQITARAASVALDWRRRPGDLTQGEIIRKIEEELDGQSDKWMDGVAAKGANEAFADGRQDGYEQHADEIASVIYSALLDINTCENCAAADGEEGPTPDDITEVPNPDCDGGDKCRCVHVYVFSDEVRE